MELAGENAGVWPKPIAGPTPDLARPNSASAARGGTEMAGGGGLTTCIGGEGGVSLGDRAVITMTHLGEVLVFRCTAESVQRQHLFNR